MKVFVTGGSGFLGSIVLDKAVAAGYGVHALARTDAAAEAVARLGAKPVPGDLDDPASLDDAFASAAAAGAEVLINLASLGFGHAPSIISAAMEAGLRRAVFISTTAVTTSLPAQSKRVRLEAEEAIRDSELDWTILRPTMIYGAAGDRNLARLLGLVRRAPLLPLPGGGGRLQQPVHVEDVAQVVLASATRPVSVRRIYNVAGPEAMTFRELIHETTVAVGHRPRVLSVPLRPTIWALRAYEKAVSKPRIKAEQLERLSEDKAFDISAAIEDLDYRPRSFRIGVRAEAAALWS